MSVKMNLVEGGFVAVKGKVWYRKGKKSGWLEVVIVSENGAEMKLVMKRVERFYSEGEDVEL